MPKFILEINLGNEGMSKAHQLADAIDCVSYRMRNGNNYDQILPTGEQRMIRDINGNVVGHYEVV